MTLAFNEDAVEWMEQQKFTEKEMEDAAKLVSIALKRAAVPLRIPEGVSLKAAAIAYAVLATLDEDTVQDRFVDISDEARQTYQEEVEIGEFEETMQKIGKVKLGKTHSGAKRKSSVKKEHGSFE